MFLPFRWTLFALIAIGPFSVRASFSEDNPPSRAKVSPVYERPNKAQADNYLLMASDYFLLNTKAFTKEQLAETREMSLTGKHRLCEVIGELRNDHPVRLKAIERARNWLDDEELRLDHSDDKEYQRQVEEKVLFCLEILRNAKVLRDGLTEQEICEILGPPTSKKQDRFVWEYHFKDFRGCGEPRVFYPTWLRDDAHHFSVGCKKP